MQRICGSLSEQYKVLLVGRELKDSLVLTDENYKQKRLKCWFTEGKLMYLEFNIRLFLFLISTSTDAVCAIDLDTIVPCFFISRIKKIKRVYDAHELFTEQKEIVTRLKIQQLWLKVERSMVPRFKYGYTVNEFIVKELERRYEVKYQVVRNLPVLKLLQTYKRQTERFIIYQGAVNEGRCFETLIPAMKDVSAKLIICGKGNFYEQVKELIKQFEVEDKVELKGYVSPNDLVKLTPTASVAITLFENTGLNQYHSLANRFFDYIMAGVPQLCVNYPEYAAVNNIHNIALLIDNTDAQSISTALNNLLSNSVLYNTLRKNCLGAREVLNWETEKKVLLEFYKKLFDN